VKRGYLVLLTKVIAKKAIPAPLPFFFSIVPTMSTSTSYNLQLEEPGCQAKLAREAQPSLSF